MRYGKVGFDLIREFKGKSPVIADSAYVDERATLIGEVKVGEESSVWPGVVIRADGGPIKIGKKTSIQDGTVVHVSVEGKVEIGDECTVGHGAIIHCEEIGDRVLVGMNSTLLEGSKIGDESIIAANSLVRDNTEVPERSFFAGSPGEVKKEISDGQVDRIKLASEHYANLSKEYKQKS